MTSRRAFSLLGIAALSSVLLAGCASSGSLYGSEDDPAVEQSRAVNKTDQISSDPVTFFITLPNGAKVLCAGINDRFGDGGGTNFDCDWSDEQGLNTPAAGQ